MANDEEIKEAVETIKECIQSGNVRFPSKVEQHGIFPIQMEEPREYVFDYVSLRGATGPKIDPKKPEWDHNGVFTLEWGAKGFGFGELTFKSVGGKMNEWGEIEGAKVVCDHESMGRDFVRAVLVHFANTVDIDV